ncbi:MAG: aminopeptidase [Treponema sp.]|jgi:aspartyl aminopeptidase|nr:aminopeptidase [Treponema sp.]
MGGSRDKEETKTEGQRLSEELFFDIKNCWNAVSPEELGELREFAEGYKDFLDKGKTEREFTGLCTDMLRQNGFVDIESLPDEGEKLQSGTKVYQNIKGKSLVCAVIGRRPLEEGMNIVGAHVDSPRLDLKTNPLYEDSGFAFFDTHYYGGIKYYQWTTIPLAMHGTLVRKDGKKLHICIGEDPGDPVFTVTDLLPHLARDQMQKKASEFFDGEDLNILAGSEPFRDEKVKERVKLKLLTLLHEKYGMVEEDFSGAEIEFVPAGKARDIGLDRSMIGGYGHDDRCCAYAAIRSILALAASPPPEKTVVCLLTDKEEIGSVGNTGIRSRFFENFAAYLCSRTLDRYSDIKLRRCLASSFMLSADVGAAYDPNYDSVYDKKTSAWFGKGMVLTKYTGRGGKYGGSDANAEFCQKVQTLLNKNKIRWQFGDIGRVDKGGGGTIALFVAELGVEVLDCGIPVLSMHSPFEVISKIDLHTTYKGYIAFLQEA